MSFLPPIPSDPPERQRFLAILHREMRALRRRPSFLVGLTLVALSGFGLLYLVPDMMPRLFFLVGVFGASCVYDTLTRHFCLALHRQELSAPPKNQQPASESYDL